MSRSSAALAMPSAPVDTVVAPCTTPARPCAILAARTMVLAVFSAVCTAFATWLAVCAPVVVTLPATLTAEPAALLPPEATAETMPMVMVKATENTIEMIADWPASAPTSSAKPATRSPASAGSTRTAPVITPSAPANILPAFAASSSDRPSTFCISQVPSLLNSEDSSSAGPPSSWLRPLARLIVAPTRPITANASIGAPAPKLAAVAQAATTTATAAAMKPAILPIQPRMPSAFCLAAASAAFLIMVSILSSAFLLA